jgi:hypothetical protein
MQLRDFLLFRLQLTNMGVQFDIQHPGHPLKMIYLSSMLLATQIFLMTNTSYQPIFINI